MCPLLSCHYPRSLFCPNVSLVWMGQTLNVLLLVKCSSFSQKCDEKSYRIAFFLFLVCSFYNFLEMTPQKVYLHDLGTKSVFKVAQKLTPCQCCSKNALNEAIFPKSCNFGTHTMYTCPFYHVFVCVITDAHFCHFSRAAFCWFNKSTFDPVLDTLYFNI